MKLELKYVSVDGLEFNVMDDNKQIGEAILMENSDSYVLSFEMYKNNFKAMDIYPMHKINEMMNQFIEYFKKNIFTLFKDLPVLLLEERQIVNRYAMEHDLQRVPRFCGYYLINN
jgi:hypothetical protein